jgi:hypothetical protein
MRFKLGHTARGAVVGAAFLLSTGCYHSILTTNLTPGTQVHHEAFKPAFIHGLVPATVDASSYCPNKRWARVETQQSFVNVLVAIVTFGIFTPLDIKVTCAA